MASTPARAHPIRARVLYRAVAVLLVILPLAPTQSRLVGVGAEAMPGADIPAIVPQPTATQDGEPGRAQLGAWNPRVYRLVAAPTDPPRLYAATWRGLFVSDDGGPAWYPTPIRGVVSELVIDPSTPTTVYAMSGDPAGNTEARFHRSTDSGATWQTINREMPGRGPVGLVVDPANPSTFYVTLDYRVYRSEDGGLTWVRFETPERSSRLFIDPRAPTTMYAWQPTGFGVRGAYTPPRLFKSSDGGMTWSEITLPPVGAAREMYGLPTSPVTLIIVTRGTSGWSIQRSPDGGTTWEGSDLGYTGREYFTLGFDPAAPATLYASLSGATNILVWEGSAPPSPESVLLTSVDGGALWSEVSSGPPVRHVTSLIADSASGALFAGTGDSGDNFSGDGIWKSLDGGRTWTPANAGLLRLVIEQLLIDPRAPATVFAITGGLLEGYGGTAVFKSVDGGDSWQESSAGLPQAYIWQLGLDPFDPQVVYAATEVGLYRSADAGLTWSATGLTDVVVTRLVLDPSTRGTLYAFTLEARPRPLQVLEPLSQVVEGSQRLQRSRDGGETWTDAGVGLDFYHANTPQRLLFDPNNPTTLFAEDLGRILRSTDGGASWQRILEAAGHLRLLGIAAEQPSVVYFVSFAGDRTALVRSSDAGDTWTATDVDISPTWPRLWVSPHDPSTIYVNQRAGLFSSTDRGESWSRVGSLPLVVQSLAIAPDGSGLLYAGTVDGGVYQWTEGGAWVPKNVGLPGGDLAPPAD